ncbi:MAG: nitrite/sulfite reductase [Armatimonadota bacterium]|nr:nitrite/sulfite reductase [Armatimonadota bacterium]
MSMNEELERAKLLRERRRSEKQAAAVADGTQSAAPTVAPKLTYEDILKRNPTERLKNEKHPLDVLQDLPALMAMPYEDIPEDDILRLQWYGLYHDKPKIGSFMLRVKIPNGILSPTKLREIGQISIDHGQNSGELTTRQDVQIHFIRLEVLPDIMGRLEKIGLTTVGGCGDNLRNITGCPAAGVDAGEYFDPTGVVMDVARLFYGNREYSNLPRKHKFSISACPHHCNAPEIHDVGLVGMLHEGREGFAVWVGGGLSTVPRMYQPFRAFVPKEQTVEVLKAIVDEWKSDMRYRLSRAKARFKFMVDDDGAAAVRERIEQRLGWKLEDLQEEPKPIGRTEHMGINAQKQPGLFYIGFPVMPGLISGQQLVQIADLLDEYGSDFRITREQNLILTGIPEENVDVVISRMGDIGINLNVNPIRGKSIACTGNPQCNFAVGPTKPMVLELVEHLEAKFGDKVANLHLHLDGCPHACGQHHVGDIGFQGTTIRTDDGKAPGYDIFLRGGLGPYAGIGKPILRRISIEDTKLYTERLVRAYVEECAGQPMQEFLALHTDAELLAIAQGA